MAHLSGSVAYLVLATTLLEGQTNASISGNVDALETTSKDSSGHKSYIAGEDDTDLTVDIRTDSTHTYGIAELEAARVAKAAIAFILGPGNSISGEAIDAGNAIITNITKNYPENDIIVASISLKVTGGYTTATSATTYA